MDANRRILLARHPQGEPGDDCYSTVTQPAPVLGTDEALARVQYLSVDPAQRMWMNPGGVYGLNTGVGAVVGSLGVGEVVESRNAAYAVGDLVYGMVGWQELVVIDSGARRAQVLPAGLPPVPALGVFGLNGQTAYWGLLDIGRPAAGETVVVSAAACATGSLVGQLARIAGARVVGLAGSAEKRAWITDGLGFDVALDYRAPDLVERFAEACPDGVDVYFDNVGGRVLDLALSRLAMRGRVVLCGAISAYNEAGFGPGPTQYRQLIRQRGRMEGFIVMDYASRYGEALEKLRAWEADGRLRHREELVSGLDQAPDALRRVLRGDHLGKLVVEV